MKAAALAILIVLSYATVAVAGTTGILNGYALNGGDMPVPNTLITLESSTTILTTRTDKRGFYTFLSLPPGVYTVSAKEHRAIARLVRVNSDQTTYLPLNLAYLNCPRITRFALGNDKRSQQFDSLDVAHMEAYPKNIAPPILLPLVSQLHLGGCL